MGNLFCSSPAIGEAPESTRTASKHSTRRAKHVCSDSGHVTHRLALRAGPRFQPGLVYVHKGNAAAYHAALQLFRRAWPRGTALGDALTREGRVRYFHCGTRRTQPVEEAAPAPLLCV